MAATGYKPGRRLAGGSATRWASAVVRIVCTYEANSGQTFASIGSGFVLTAWPGIVLTARHVVARAQAIDEARLSIVISTSNGTSLEEVEGLGVAYPMGNDADVAAIVIAGASPTGLPLANPFPADGEEVHGVVHGYVAADARFISLSSRVARARSLLRELDRPSIAGMSGGPVCTQGPISSGVFGIQSSDHSGRGLATVIDFDVLNECAEYARSYVP